MTTVLLLGATGRTGGRVLAELLAREVAVRAIVRTAARLSAATRADPRLLVREASLLELDDAAWVELVAGCDAVISCLGHVLDLRGIFGPPRDLVTQAMARVRRAIEVVRPVRVVLMTSVSVHHPPPHDARRGGGERAFLAVLRALVPPARDNQSAADLLRVGVGRGHPKIRWVVVRPDTLLDGDVSPYEVHPELVDSLHRAGTTRMANVAHFVADLVTSETTWARWEGTMPAIVDVRVVPRPRSPRRAAA